MKKALLVGINTYTRQKNLRGCLTDVSEMRSTLSEVFDFDQDQMDTLTEGAKN